VKNQTKFNQQYYKIIFVGTGGGGGVGAGEGEDDH